MMGHYKNTITNHMTRKDALDVLHQLKEKYTDVLSYEQFKQEQESEFRRQLYNAFKTLTAAVYGPPHSEQCPFLCDRCHRHYADLGCAAEYVDDAGAHHFDSCCKPCHDQLKAEGKLVESQVQA